MRAQEIRELLNATPFVPFNLHLSDGHTVEVKHQDFAWMIGNRLRIGMLLPKNWTGVLDSD